MERFNVELDFSAVFATEVFAASPMEAYEKAMRKLKDEPFEVREVPSFQIYDERMQVRSLTEETK